MTFLKNIFNFYLFEQKKSHIFGICCLIILSSCKPPAQVQQTFETTLKIAIVDLDYLLHESMVSYQISDFLDTKRKKYHTEMAQTEQILRKTHKELQDNQTSFSKEEFALARQNFENHVSENQRLLEEQKQELERLQTESNKIIKTKIDEIITRIFHQKDLNLVLLKNNVLLYSEKLDISAEIMHSLNEELPSIDLTTLQNISVSTD